MKITRPARGFATLAAATALYAGAPAGQALAQQQTLSVDAGSDSVMATGLPGGDTTVRVTRPDAITGAPVVIGMYAGSASILPFTVNTTVPTAFDPDGDCWQGGAVALPGGLGLTPDIRAGDTVAVNPGPSLKVPAGADPGESSGGPIYGCNPLSAYAGNRVTAATGGSGADVAVGGVAQPLASGVSVTAADGRATTAPVDGALAADGTWTATIPAGEIAELADGSVTITPVFAVPDLATGAPAHIAGAPRTLATKAPAGDGAQGDQTPQTPPGAPAAAPPQPAPSAKAVGGLTSIRATSRITLSRARRGGIRVSFVVPAGAKVARIRLARGTTTAYRKFVAVAAPGTRQTVKLSGTAFTRKLRRGTYTLSVTAGPSRSELGRPIASTVRVR